MKEKVLKQLKKIGVFVHRGGFDYDRVGAMFNEYPVCAIWNESEEPTDEEIGLLAEIVRERLERYNPAYVKNFCVEGANTVTFNKRDGLWTYRKLTWRVGPTWHPQARSLREIKESGHF